MAKRFELQNPDNTRDQEKVFKVFEDKEVEIGTYSKDDIVREVAEIDTEIQEMESRKARLLALSDSIDAELRR